MKEEGEINQVWGDDGQEAIKGLAPLLLEKMEIFSALSYLLLVNCQRDATRTKVSQTLPVTWPTGGRDASEANCLGKAGNPSISIG